MQIVAVLLIATGFGAFLGAIGGLEWGIGSAGLLLFFLSLTFLLDIGGDE